MMNIFNNIISLEGGYSDNKHDKAHQLRVTNGDSWDSYATKYGISQSTLSDYFDRQATKSEVRELTKTHAKDIYRRIYFTTPKIDLLPEILQEVVFDMAVNAGVSRAVLILQGLLNDGGYGISKDGMIGMETLTAAKSAVEKFGGYFVNAYVEERVMFYQSLITHDETQSVFRKGWMKRAIGFLVIGQGDDVARNLAGVRI